VPESVVKLSHRDQEGRPERGTWGQELNPIFSHGTLLLPRKGRPEDDPEQTFSPAAAIRQSAQRTTVALRRPPKDARAVLKKLGCDDLASLRNNPRPVATKGVFSTLDSLGATVAFFDKETDLHDVRSELERDYSGGPLYQRLNGTSMATPYVAAIAALYRSQRPTLTVTEVWDKLLQTASDLPGEDRGRIGAGLARFVPGRP
jgi:hypothetical protein